MRPPAGSTLDAYERERAADQHQRSSFPTTPRRTKHEQTRRSPARCGWRNYLYKRDDPARGRSVWQACERRDCPHCGPRIRQRDLDHDLANMHRQPMTRRVLVESAFPAATAKVRRADGRYTAYPQADGTVAVYASAGLTGSVVDDLDAAAAADYDRMPMGAYVRRSRPWAMTSGKSTTPPAWGSLGMGSKPPEQATAILAKLGLSPRPVPPRELPENVWEADDFTVPPFHTPAFDRFARGVGLHEPARQQARPKRRREVA